MRILYKALASIGMLALSTAAAIGIRRLTRSSQKRHAEDPKSPENTATESPIRVDQPDIPVSQAASSPSSDDDCEEVPTAADASSPGTDSELQEE